MDLDDELHFIIPERLDKMDLMATECWNCAKCGRSLRDCKLPRYDSKLPRYDFKLPQDDKKVNLKCNSTGRNKYGTSHGKCFNRTLHQTVEGRSDGDDSQSDYGVLNPSGSEDDEEALDVLNLMSASCPAENNSDYCVSDGDDSHGSCDSHGSYE